MLEYERKELKVWLCGNDLLFSFLLEKSDWPILG